MRMLIVLALLVAACTRAPVAGPPPPAAGTLPAATGATADTLDTSTQQERDAALAPAAGATRSLGTVTASLGSPAEPGIWIKTPLVTGTVPGRAVWTATGATISVELRPADDASGTTQISLAALRLLDIPLTEIAVLSLSTGG